MNILQTSDHISHNIPANSVCCKLDLSLLNYLTEHHQEAGLHCLQTVDLLHLQQSFHSPPSCHLHTSPATAQQFCHRNVKSVDYHLGFQLPHFIPLFPDCLHRNSFPPFFMLQLITDLLDLKRRWCPDNSAQDNSARTIRRGQFVADNSAQIK